MELPKILSGAEPQFYRGNAIGCLVVHGFMATPSEVGWMGQHLAQQGYTVYVPRLTGHGINATHMNRMRWEDWYAQVLDGYRILRQQCEQIYFIGHSMGGLLGLLLAAQESLHGLVVAAAPLKLTRRSIPYAKWLSWFVPYTHHPSEGNLNSLIEAEQKRRGEPILSRVHYPQWSTRAVYELYRLVQIVPEYLPQVSTRLMLLYSPHDNTAPPSNMELIEQAVQSLEIERYLMQTGAHIMFQDEGREEAFQAVANFVAKCVTFHSTN